MQDFWIHTRWLKRRYYVRDGYVRPVIGSPAVVYDPFQYYYSLAGPRSGTSIYVELTGLDLQSEQQIEQFCSKWGLLGLFTDGLLQARWPAAPGYAEYDLVDIERARLVMDEGPDRPTALVEQAAGNYREVSLVEHYQRYFPDLDLSVVKTAGDMLRLLQPSVWDHLSEPLAEFRTAARKLQTTATTLAGERGALLQSQYQHELNLRTRRVAPFLRESPDGWERAWRFPSLLSALYGMVLMDFTDGQLLVCKKCGRPFSPKGKRPDLSKYCSSQCYEAAKKQAKREKARGEQGSQENRE